MLFFDQQGDVANVMCSGAKLPRIDADQALSITFMTPWDSLDPWYKGNFLHLSACYILNSI